MKISVAPLVKRPYGATEEYDLGEDDIEARSEHAALVELGVHRVSGGVVGTHTQPGVYVDGEVTASVDLECSRCLDRFRRDMPVHMSEQYYALYDVASGARLAPPPPDAYSIDDDFVIDFTTLLREHILLELPLKPLCREDCAGICPICGLDQNQRPHRHEAEADERWSRLRTLLTDLDRGSREGQR